jgi:hypothetical protein
MGSFFQRPRVRTFLTAFKWCRVTVLLAVLLVVAAVTYLQLVGLPDFLKNPLLRALRRRGFDAQFASARLGWGPSIVIENAAFSPTNEASGPRLSAEWTQLNLNAAALLHARLQVESFQILQGGLRLPIAPTNEEPLILTDVNLNVSLASNNVARLLDGTAWSRGVRIHLNGEIRNFLSIRDWKFKLPLLPAAPTPPAVGQPKPAPGLTVWQVLRSIYFTGRPELNLHFYADGLDENTLRGELQFSAASTQTPWGRTGLLKLRAVCARLLNSGNTPLFQTRFQAHDVTTPWAASRDLSVSLDLSRDATTNFLADVHLASHEASANWRSPSGSNWVRVTDLRWEGASTLPSLMAMPATFAGTLRATQTESVWGSVGAASLVLQTRHLEDASPLDPAWGQWNRIKPFTLDCQAEATNILTPELKLDRVAVQGGWHPPQLTIEKLEAVMYRGHLSAGGALDVDSRQLQVRAAVDFDPHQISPMLSGPAQHWISLYDWEAPPNLSAGLRFVLPPWTNRIDLWRVDLWPEDSRDSIQLAGDFSVGRGAYRGIAVTSAQSHFTYTNRVWNVTGLRVAGPGGALGLDYDWSDVTHAYHFRVDSELDPAVALPLLAEPQQRVLSQFSFADKPEIQGDLWGNWQTPAATGFAAKLATGHFIFRGESVNQLRAQVEYTNHFLRVSQFSLAHDTGRVEVPLATVDLASKLFFITNATSSIDPEPVRRALGKIAPPFMNDVHFGSPPLVKASGTFIPNNDLGTDLYFIVQGDHFRWNFLNADSAQGAVHYHVRTVDVTNIQTRFYTGQVQGWITLEWELSRGTWFNSDWTLKNIDLGALAADLTAKNTKIEGKLDGHLALSAPSEATDTNLFGHGSVRVHNGLLWDIKLFGIFSPILNAIAPGSGRSRAREASATFTITNGVASTDDLEIRSSGFRLLYRGTVDSRKRLNARVVANLLRDTPVFGNFLGWMFTPLDKLFEYRVTGTLSKPIMQPLYIPKAFMAMLRPFRTLKELLPPPVSTKPSLTPPPATAPVTAPATTPPTASPTAPAALPPKQSN